MEKLTIIEQLRSDLIASLDGYLWEAMEPDGYENTNFIFNNDGEKITISEVKTDLNMYKFLKNYPKIISPVNIKKGSMDFLVTGLVELHPAKIHLKVAKAKIKVKLTLPDNTDEILEKSFKAISEKIKRRMFVHIRDNFSKHYANLLLRLIYTNKRSLKNVEENDSKRESNKTLQE